MRMKRISSGHYEYKGYKVFKATYRRLGDTKPRTYWKVYTPDTDSREFDTLRDAREYIKASLCV